MRNVWSLGVCFALMTCMWLCICICVNVTSISALRLLHGVSEKYLTFDNNFGTGGPIFKILSPVDL